MMDLGCKSNRRDVDRLLSTHPIFLGSPHTLVNPSSTQNRLALSALSTADPKSVLSQRSATIADTQSFNIKISLEGAPITNQRSSGRCWLFAATNVFRVAIMRRYNLKEFELSQSFLFFWDKLEKANYFLEQILDTTDEELDGRLVQELMSHPVGDGGQWDMVANLVEKYGLVSSNLLPICGSSLEFHNISYISIWCFWASRCKLQVHVRCSFLNITPVL